MFQSKSITLTNKDRSRGERIAISSGGGIYFDSAPNGIFISFDDSPIQLPVKAGRSYDVRFSSATLWHPSGYAGELLVILYEKGEGIFDNAGSGAGSSPSSAGASRVVVSIPYQQGAAQHNNLILWNAPGSGVVYTLRYLYTWQSATVNSMDDAFNIGTAAAQPGAAVDGVWGVAVRDSKAVGYVDASRGAVSPKLLASYIQTAARLSSVAGVNVTRRYIGRHFNQENTHPQFEGAVIRPGSFFAYESAAIVHDGWLRAELDEESVAS